MYSFALNLQVRLAASVATREFLQTLPDSESRDRFYPKILPAMCLNRYSNIGQYKLFQCLLMKVTKEMQQRFISITLINRIVSN